MQTRKTTKELSVARKKRIISALKRQELTPAEIAEKADLPISTLAGLVKEYLGIADSDISMDELFARLKGNSYGPASETAPNEHLPAAENLPSSKMRRSPNSFSLAAKGRILAALKSGDQTPQEIADQAGISLETLAQWAGVCLGLTGKEQPPADIFRMFQTSDPFAGKRKSKTDSASSGWSSRLPAQLCWDCINAVPDGRHGCPWSKSFTPVEGWQAVETVGSYCITACPLFEKG